jgi:hypothetical protein
MILLEVEGTGGSQRGSSRVELEEGHYMRRA